MIRKCPRATSSQSTCSIRCKKYSGPLRLPVFRIFPQGSEFYSHAHPNYRLCQSFFLRVVQDPQDARALVQFHKSELARCLQWKFFCLYENFGKGRNYTPPRQFYDFEGSRSADSTRSERRSSIVSSLAFEA